MYLHVQVAWFWALSGFFLILYCTVHTILFSTVKGYKCEGVGQRLFFSFETSVPDYSCWEVCLLWSDGLSLKHIQCFLLMSRDCLPTLWLVQKDGANFWLAQSTVLISYWMRVLTSREIHILTWIYKLRGQSCKCPLHSSTLLCLLSPPCPYLGWQKYCWTYWRWPRLYWVFLSGLRLTSVGYLYVLSDI